MTTVLPIEGLPIISPMLVLREVILAQNLTLTVRSVDTGSYPQTAWHVIARKHVLTFRMRFTFVAVRSVDVTNFVMHLHSLEWRYSVMKKNSLALIVAIGTFAVQ